MDNLFDTQSKITTVRGESFPYQFGVDLVRQTVIIYNTQTQQVRSVRPAEAQRLADDKTLDAHRHALYSAAWEYWKSQGTPS